METGGDPAREPDRDDDVDAADWPPSHPDRRRRTRVPRLRRWWPITHRHYDAINERIDRIDQKREEDFQELWNFLADLAETPDSIAIREILEHVADIELAAQDHYERRDAEWRAFLDELATASRDYEEASRRVSGIAARMLGRPHLAIVALALQLTLQHL